MTLVEKAPTFYPAEKYHQQYYETNPSQAYCSFVISPKIEKLKKLYSPYLKKRLHNGTSFHLKRLMLFCKKVPKDLIRENTINISDRVIIIVGSVMPNFINLQISLTVAAAGRRLMMRYQVL